MKTNLNNKYSLAAGFLAVALAVVGMLPAAGSHSVLLRDGNAPQYPASVTGHLDEMKVGNPILDETKAGNPILSVVEL